MLEREVKVLEVDVKLVLDVLESLGAKKVFDDLIFSTYFDFPDMRYRKRDVTIRLRKEGKKVKFTVKSANFGKRWKETEEYEVEVSSFETFDSLLRFLGFECYLTYKKHRISYVFDNVRVDIDTYLDSFSFVPPFLEIEVRGKADLDEILEKLRLKSKRTVNWTGLELLEYYKRKN